MTHEIIRGKIYDTENADLVATIGPQWVRVYDGSLYIEEKYYRTKNGEYFEASRCPPAPSFWGWLMTGGFKSEWRLRPLTKEEMTSTAHRLGLGTRLGLIEPIQA